MSSFTKADYAIARDQVIFTMASLQEGNHMIVCPLCMGGNQKDKAMSVTIGSDRAGLYKCHRASCQWGGAIFPSGVSVIDIPRPTFVPRPLTRDLDVGETVDELLAFDGTLLGHQTRLKYKDGSKKVLTYPLTSRAGHCVVLPKPNLQSKSLWLVEDIASARVLAANGRLACALLGTSASIAFIEFELAPAIRYYGITRILIALDPGAEDAAMSIKQKLTGRLSTDNLCIPLRSDVKDMGETELKSLLEYYDYIPSPPIGYRNS